MDPEADTTFQSALRRLLGLADYERMAGIATPVPKYDLARMRELADRMGNPQRTVPVVHIAGTKGKGSTAAMVSSILAASGKRVGLFTSPHLHSFRERLRVNGIPLSEARFSAALDRVWPIVEAMSDTPTTFEVLTAMAFDLPVSEEVDMLVLEVGLGGRLDSTNVTDATVDVITSISLDHTAILGDTIEEIAAEKAGIVKSDSPVFVAPQRPEAMEVVERRASGQGAPLARVGHEIVVAAKEHSLAGQRFSVTTGTRAFDLSLPLLGAHQQENAALAVAVAEYLGVSEDAITRGVADVTWDGRFQVVQAEGPIVIVDGAHNPQSMGVLRETLAEYVSADRVIVVFGCSGDKELGGMVDEVARFADEVVICASRHPRSVSVTALSEEFTRAGVAVRESTDVATAMDVAQRTAGSGGAVVATGSLFVVGEALEAWNGTEPERYPELDRKEPAVG